MVDNAVMIIAIFAVVVIVVAVAFRHRLRAIITGPGGIGLRIDGSNPEPRLGIQAKNITSQKERVIFTDETSHGIDADTVSAYKDVNITSRLPQENPLPKPPPPA